MTRCEVRLLTCKKGYRIASFFNNSSSYLDRIVPIIEIALNKFKKEQDYSRLFSDLSGEFDCSPVANTSYIYEIYLDTFSFKVFKVIYDSKRILWKKGKCIKEVFC
jgi:hypothetical protein